MTTVRECLAPLASAEVELFGTAPVVLDRAIAARRLHRNVPRGTHHRRDPNNAFLMNGATLVGRFQIPKIEPTSESPPKLIAFSEAIRADADTEAWVHFYEDDAKFIRIWDEPEKWCNHLQRFAGVIAPDFSTYRNMACSQRIGNQYRNYALAAWYQRCGISTIANVRVDGLESVEYSLAGAPSRSLLAISTHGCVRNRNNRVRVTDGLRVACETLEPAGLVVYGTDWQGVLDYARIHDIPVELHRPDTYRRSVNRGGRHV